MAPRSLLAKFEECIDLEIDSSHLADLRSESSSTNKPDADGIQNNININDIEVLKVREGEGGTLRLGFDSEESADYAVVLLNEIGYRVRRP